MSHTLSWDPTSAECHAFDVRGLSFRYESSRGHSTGDRPRWVIDGIEFTVRAGEILGVIGPNGSGKSSLLKLLANLVQPQQGSVRLFGSELLASPRESLARQVAYMPQDLMFDFPFSVVDMVLMGRYPHRRGGVWSMVGWERREDLAVAEEAMAITDLTNLADRMVGTLSAGERQRVLLARALAQQPRVLLLDEPTAHLDLNHQLDLCRILTQAHERLGMTVVMVSHDINLASQYCNRILMMKQGKLVCLGAPQEVVCAAILTDVYGCRVRVDTHPETGLPRVSLPSPDCVQAGPVSEIT